MRSLTQVARRIRPRSSVVSSSSPPTSETFRFGPLAVGYRSGINLVGNMRASHVGSLVNGERFRAAAAIRQLGHGTRRTFSSANLDVPHVVDTVYPEGEFKLANGRVLPAGSMQIKYATWGDPSNPPILVCPSMSNSAYAADSTIDEASGWWRDVIGPGERYGIDTTKFYVICGAALGGPFGTTSPVTINPTTGERWGPDFPQITPEDMAQCQALLLDSIGIDKVFAVVGGSMGGMQVLQFAAKFPDRYDRFASISASGHTPPSTVALRSAQRAAVSSDPDFMDGWYPAGKGPVNGMQVARIFGVIGYRSRVEFDKRFDWFPKEGVDAFGNAVLDGSSTSSFEVERYLQYQATKFTSVVNYDANCYLLLSRAMDRMNLGTTTLEEGVARIPKEKEGLILNYNTDTLTPPADMEYLSSIMGGLGIQVYYEELKSQYGHDAFLIHRESPALNFRLRPFLDNSHNTVKHTLSGSGVDHVRNVVRDLHEY